MIWGDMQGAYSSEGFDKGWRLISVKSRTVPARGLPLYLLIFVACFFPSALAQSEFAIPENIKLPSDHHLVLRAHASGVQVYVCQPAPGGTSQFAWLLSGPEAKLVDDTGTEVATHFAGPTWRSTDGSQVKGKVVAQSVPDPDSIPWLLLTAVDHSGTGIMSNVVNIQRLTTKGGKPPATGCDAQHQGETTRVSYTADYYFYTPGN